MESSLLVRCYNKHRRRVVFTSPACMTHKRTLTKTITSFHCTNISSPPAQRFNYGEVLCESHVSKFWGKASVSESCWESETNYNFKFVIHIDSTRTKWLIVLVSRYLFTVQRPRWKIINDSLLSSLLDDLYRNKYMFAGRKKQKGPICRSSQLRLIETMAKYEKGSSTCTPRLRDLLWWTIWRSLFSACSSEMFRSCRRLLTWSYIDSWLCDLSTRDLR